MNTLSMANIYAVAGTGKPKRTPKKSLIKNRSWKRHRFKQWRDEKYMAVRHCRFYKPIWTLK